MGFHSKSFRFEGGGRRIIGLKRTGKSCRLRWVNYLHPGLKRGKMAPHEERLVLELHSKWGNRWSRIARKLPGRTDNEIKNYWRTHMRKKAQERKKAMYPSPSSSLSNSSSSSSSQGNSPTVESVLTAETKERSFYDTGGFEFDNMATAATARGKKNTTTTTSTRTHDDHHHHHQEEEGEYYPIDEIWKDIELSEDDTIKPVYADGGNSNLYSCQTMVSPVWDYCPVSLWSTDEEESKMFSPITDQIYSFHSNQENEFTVTG